MMVENSKIFMLFFIKNYLLIIHDLLIGNDDNFRVLRC